MTHKLVNFLGHLLYIQIRYGTMSLKIHIADQQSLTHFMN